MGCCRLQFCFCGFELKVGIWTLAILEILLGSCYVIVEASGSLNNVDWIKRWLHMLIYIIATLSVIGGFVLIIGIARKNHVLLIAGTLLGYPVAIFNVIALIWQIYFSIVLCSFLEQIG
ncbi:uncharacterized protein LOC111518374 isoform X2 [Drosophila willistoni]|uniref:uncharacterized protein LOC111518374 isoform X2 n=1 Tax=Drosophila willistoni TaxID=7260 RepID=UPI000C26C528|nr:uncharacterized protein LOC111518374 isoform X2 [Drosophila willistoni]